MFPLALLTPSQAPPKKLIHTHSNNNYTRNFYFNRLRNKLPSIDLNSQPVITSDKVYYLRMIIYNNILGTIFHLTFHVRTIFALDVLTAITQDYPVTSQ